MAHEFDAGEFKVAALLPEITRDMYMDLPEDVCKEIEVVDGWMVRRERPTPSHQTIQVNFVMGLREAVKRADAKDRTCHRVSGDLDMLISDGPKFHFRSTDVVVHRCIAEKRGRWGARPYASDCVLVTEIVCADSIEHGVDAVTSQPVNLLHEVRVLVVDGDAAEFPDHRGPLA